MILYRLFCWLLFLPVWLLTTLTQAALRRHYRKQARQVRHRSSAFFNP